MLVLVAAFSALGGFLFGYDLGLIGGALLNIRDAFGIGDGAAEAIVGAAKFGAFFGTFLGGALMLHYGRRKAIAIDSIFFIVGPLVMALSFNVAGLVVGRVIVGLGVGISAAVVPAYLGEVAPAKVRGRVVETYELLLCVGMLAAALGDAAFQSLPGNWRWMVGAPLVPALLLSLALCVLPESPRWLVIRGRLDEALAVIHRMYTHSILPAGVQNSTAEVEEELMQLWSSVEKDREAAVARRQEYEERLRRRQEQRETKVAPISSGSPSAGAGTGGAAAVGGDEAGPQFKGGWQRLQPAEGDEAEAEAAAGGAAAAGGVGAVAAGAAGVQQRMQQAVVDMEAGTGGGSAEQDAEPNGADQRSLLPSGAAASDSSGSGGPAAHMSNGQAPAPASPLKVPAHLPRIRTSLADLQAAAGGSSSGNGVGTPLGADVEATAAAAAAAGSSRQQPPSPHVPGALEGHEHEQGPVTARYGAGNDGFWRTLRNMLGDIYIVACGPERKALQMALWLAFFNQAFASTSIINYAPQVLQRAGVESHAAASLLSSAVGGSKLLGVVLSLFLVDSLGRRPLLLWGSFGSAASLAALVVADWLAIRAFLLAGMCSFIFAFSVSWAGVFWVQLSEIFSMSAKSPATSAATAMLFLTGAVVDTLFLTLHGWLGPLAFLLFALLAAAAGLYVAAVVPETKGKTLQEVQELLALRVAPGSRRRGWWQRRQQDRRGLLPPGAVLSDAAGSAGLAAPSSLELPQHGTR